MQNSTLLSSRLFAAGVTVCAIAGAAQAQLRVMNWNVASIKGDPNAIRDVVGMASEDDKAGFAVAPAILVFQEVHADDINALEALVDAAIPGINYTRGTFTTSSSEDAAGGAQAVFYRSSVVTEIPALHVDLDTGAGRKSDRWQFQLVGYSSAAAKFFVYASHLKASTGAANEDERLFGAQVIRNNSDALAQGTHIIYCGDFNLYSNGEPAYDEFLSLGNGQASDPLGTGSWGGAGNAIKHSQSPRDISAGGLVGGAMDDRFDFQLSSGEFQDGNGLSMIAGTYRSFGNDGQHYNVAINSGNNTYWPGDVPGSNALADLLFDASDHIPIIVDYQVPGVLSAAMTPNFGKVIQGAVVSVSALVQNTAAGVPAGIDSLDVQAVGTGALIGSGTTVAPLAPLLASIPLSVNTSQVGFVSGGATVTALSEAAQNASFLLSTSGQVVRASNASFSPAVDTNATTVSETDEVGVSSVPLSVPVHNFGYDLSQALLDIDLIGGLGDGFSLVSGLTSGIGGRPATLQFTFNATGKPAGTYSKVVAISVSDEDIPGSGSAQISVTLSVTLESALNPADLDGNGSVNGADLAILLGQWGSNGTADLDGSGNVDGADLAILLGAWL
ncbi:MAG: hypothetical protein JNL80_11095 [Phycisphaerae bacterium]|jgi:hypothetical protein|nr:hypothetical protein [Phycisphaerae bacterium]